MSLLVFTDLDGTLMEHETYSIEPARPALAAIAERGLTLIMNSSKTAAEIAAIQAQLGMTAPYVCENGAALFNLPDAAGKPQQQIFARPRADWLSKVHALREQLNLSFDGFADWSAQQIRELTGLDLKSAELARQREYSEPILWRDTGKALQQFKASLQQLQLQLIEGGRFLSIQSGYDKATAMRWLRENTGDGELITVALGDSPNDIAMLAAADVAVVIKSAKSEQIKPSGPQLVIRSKRPGPAGWQDAMLEVLELFDAGKLKPN